MKAAKLEIGVLRPEAAGQEAGGKRKKEGARRSIFTNMRCSHQGERSYQPDSEIAFREMMKPSPMNQDRFLEWFYGYKPS